MFIWKVVFFISVWKSVPAASLALNQSSQVPTASLALNQNSQGNSTISKTVFSCEHNELHLSCDESQIIHIIRANYGRLTRDLCNDDGQVEWSGEDCISDRSHVLVTERCKGKQRCSISASNSVFGDPCPGTIKYLEVQYVCVSESNVNSTTEESFTLNSSSEFELDAEPDTTLDNELYRTQFSCEHKVLNLDCEEGSIIHIIRANYGRLNRDLCNADRKVVWSGKACMAVRSNFILTDRCDQKQRCSVSASNYVFGDPCLGTIKYLEVQYNCVSQLNFTGTSEESSTLNSSSSSVLASVSDTIFDGTLSKTVYSCEHNELHIECVEGGVIHIIRANYGRLNRSLCNDDGQVEWSGKQCMSHRSHDIMTDRCEQKQRCSVSASNYVFGDPCRGTIKYLEVQYVCVSPSSVTSTTEDYSKLNNTSASVLGSVPDTTLDSRFFKTAYSCQENMLHLSCVERGVIRIIRASYGRLVRDLCNDDGQVVWSGEKCVSAESLKIMSQRCEKNERCSVLASNNVFGDKCHGTMKYLEVQYVCVSPSNDTSTTEDSSELNSTSSSVPDTTLGSSPVNAVYSCENNVLHIGCVEGSVIRVIRANYGRLTRNMCNDDGQVVWSGEQCTADISYLITINRCEQKERCSVTASNSIFGDPCVGTIKYLEVQYICVSPSNASNTTGESQNLNSTSASVPDNTLDNTLLKTVCEHNVIHLDCLRGSVIHIIRANYGRLTRNVCNDDGQVVWSGDNCTSVDSSVIMAMSCEKKERCSVSASNNVFGDPCHGTIKYLEVQYVCVKPINITSTTGRTTVSTSSTPTDPGSKQVTTSPRPYNLLLRNYINLNIYYNQELRKNKETKSEDDDGDFVPKWDNFNKHSCLNDSLSEDETVKNVIDSVLPKNSNLFPAPQNLSILVNADGTQIFDVDDIMKENEIGNDKYVLEPDLESTPLKLMEGKRKENTYNLTEKKKHVPSKRCKDVIKYAKHYLQHLKSTEVEDVEEAYGHYISESLRSIVDPKEREMARIELQKVLMKYRFAKDPE